MPSRPIVAPHSSSWLQLLCKPSQDHLLCSGGWPKWSFSKAGLAVGLLDLGRALPWSPQQRYFCLFFFIFANQQALALCFEPGAQTGFLSPRTMPKRANVNVAVGAIALRREGNESWASCRYLVGKPSLRDAFTLPSSKLHGLSNN